MPSYEINVRALKSVAYAVSNEETRFYLCGVNLEFLGDHVVMTATDGHGLIVARHQADNPMRHGPVIVPSKLIARIKLHRHIDVATLTVDDHKLVIDYAGDIYGDTAIDGSFPDYRRIMPKDISGVKAQFDLNQAMVFLKARQTMLNNKKTSSPVIYHNGTSPALVDILGDEGRDAGVNMMGVLMPFHRRNDDVVPYYSWAMEYPKELQEAA